MHSTDHNLHTNDCKCPGPSFGSLDVCIDFPISPGLEIHSVFFIKTHTNGCLHNEFFSLCWPKQYNASRRLRTK